MECLAEYPESLCGVKKVKSDICILSLHYKFTRNTGMTVNTLKLQHKRIKGNNRSSPSHNYREYLFSA